MNEDKKLKLLRSNAVNAYENGTPADKSLLEKLWPGEFTPVDVTVRLKTWELVLQDQGKTVASFAKENIGLPDDEVSYRSMKLLSRALNELKDGEELDPTKTWYFPVFNRDPGFGFSRAVYVDWGTVTTVGSRLSYKESRLAMFAGKTFPQIFKPFMLVLKNNQSTNQ